MSDDESTTRGCSVSEAGQGSPSLPTDAATDSEDNEAVRHRHGEDVRSTRSSSGGSEDHPVVRKRCSFMMADVLASRSPPPQQLPLHPPDNSLSILKSIQRIVENHAKLLQSPLDRRKSFNMIGHHLQSSGSESGSDFPPRSGSPPCPPPAHQAALLPSAALNFSIDNILRPDFRLASRIAQLRAFQAAAAAAAAAAAVSGADRCCPEPVDLRRARKPPQQLQQPASTGPGSAAAGRQPSASPTPQHPPLPASDQNKWPAWVYCTRYSDRPSSGPRIRKVKKRKTAEEKRPRTAFTSDQLARLKVEFQQNRYLTEKRRQDLANELGLNESQIKIWFQNKRAKLKKSVGARNPLAMSLMTEGLYNHATVAIEDEEC